MGKAAGSNSSAAGDSIGSVAMTADTGAVSSSGTAATPLQGAGANISMKEIFADVSGVNAGTTTVSSIGTFVSDSQRMIADARYKEIIGFIPKESLAFKILTDTKGNLSDKQKWVVSYELAKSSVYKDSLAQRNAEVKAFEKRQQAAKQARNARRQERANAYAAEQGMRPLQRGERVANGSQVFDKYGTSFEVVKRSGDIFYIRDANGRVSSSHKSKIYVK